MTVDQAEQEQEGTPQIQDILDVSDRVKAGVNGELFKMVLLIDTM